MHQKHKSLTVLTAILFMAAASTANAQGGYWKQLNGPTGGFSQDMVAGPDGTIYLVTQNELFKRSPASAGWLRIGMLPFKLDGMIPQPLFAADDRLFLMNDIAGAGLEFTTDEGKSWTTISAPVHGMATMQGTLYGINDDEILRSSDSGTSWKTVLRDSTFSFANITAGAAGKLFATGNGIYTNVQGDTAWQLHQIPNVSEWDFILAVDSNICIAIPRDGYGNELYRTSNGGLEWDSVGNFGYYAPIAKDSSGTLWAVMGSGSPVMMSYDSGATWINTHSSSVEAKLRTSNFCVSPTNEVYLRTLQHIYHYSRSTQQWFLWEDSLFCSNIYSIFLFSEDSLLAVCNQGYYRTGNGGQSWTKDSMDHNVEFSGSLMIRGPINLLRDRDGYLYSGQLRYDPKAAEWKNIVDVLDSIPILRFCNPIVLGLDSSGFVFGYDNNKPEILLRSSDHGITWDSISSSGWGQMAVDRQGRIIAPSGNSILRSSDHGETWTTLASGYSVGAMVVAQNGTILAEDEGADGLGYYYMIESTDDGATWQVNRQFEPWSFALDDSNKLYTAGMVWSAHTALPTMGIMISTDTGKTSQIISQSIDTAFDFVAVSPNHQLYAGSAADGIFRYIPAASSVEKTAVSSPENFTIIPNPATNEIQVTSTERNFSILDPLGRTYEVRQSGNTLDVSALPSGVYFVSDGHSRMKFVKE
ncbi:MAG: T9SS type A sorting domain-containing protein [Candidatus Kapaibacterium sp.]